MPAEQVREQLGLHDRGVLILVEQHDPVPLPEIGAPTLLLWGKADPFAPLAGARRFEREIPGSRLVAIEGAGHFVYDEQPERCAGEILDFLAA